MVKCITTSARISPHRDLQISPSPSQASLSSLHCSFTWHQHGPVKCSSHSISLQNKPNDGPWIKSELDLTVVQACFYLELRVYLSVSTQNVMARGAVSWPGQLLSPPSLSQVLVPAHSPDREKKLAPKLTQDRTRARRPWAGTDCHLAEETRTNESRTDAGRAPPNRINPDLLTRMCKFYKCGQIFQDKCLPRRPGPRPEPWCNVQGLRRYDYK